MRVSGFELDTYGTWVNAEYTEEEIALIQSAEDYPEEQAELARGIGTLLAAEIYTDPRTTSSSEALAELSLCMLSDIDDTARTPIDNGAGCADEHTIYGFANFFRPGSCGMKHESRGVLLNGVSKSVWVASKTVEEK